ncbi:MAG TPA: flavin reductase family protein, partial [Dehalococcoidia bacterium]
QFKRALGLWASGVTVVSTRTNGLIYCMTASSFSSLSIDPLLIIVCVARSAKLHELVEASGAFAVNVLRDDQRAIGEAFARTGREPSERFDFIETFDGPTGSPIFSPCLAYLDCRVHRVYDGGDHSIVVGEVQAAGSDESGMPLIYFNRSYRAVRDLEY